MVCLTRARPGCSRKVFAGVPAAWATRRHSQAVAVQRTKQLPKGYCSVKAHQQGTKFVYEQTTLSASLSEHKHHQGPDYTFIEHI